MTNPDRAMAEKRGNSQSGVRRSSDRAGAADEVTHPLLGCPRSESSCQHDKDTFWRSVKIQAKDEASEGEIISMVVCVRCGHHTFFAKPTQADLERGRELAEKYGW